MPKLQATVPKGAPPNALLRVRLPDGSEVNVRIPEGVSEGQEFIFDINSVGGVTTSASTSQNNGVSNIPKSSAKKDSSLNKSNKHAKKKNKKSSHTSTIHNNNKAEKAPSFVTFFFNYYNLCYDIVSSTLDGPKKYEVRVPPKTKTEYVGLLDREIITGVDFCVALCVGIYIGLSIVLGFISGVLWVTPIGIEA